MYSGYWYSGLFVDPNSWNSMSSEDWKMMTPYTHIHYCYMDFSKNRDIDDFEYSNIYTNGALITSECRINTDNTIQNNFVPIFQIKKNAENYQKKFILVFRDCVNNTPLFTGDSNDTIVLNILKSIVNLRNFINFDGIDFCWDMSYENSNRFLFLGRLCSMLKKIYPKNFEIYISIKLDQLYPVLKIPIIALVGGIKYDNSENTKDRYFSLFNEQETLDCKVLFSVIDKIHIITSEPVTNEMYPKIQTQFCNSGKFVIDTDGKPTDNLSDYSVFYINKPMRNYIPNQQQPMIDLYICNKLFGNEQGRCLKFGGDNVGSFRNWDFQTIQKDNCENICTKSFEKEKDWLDADKIAEQFPFIKENYVQKIRGRYHWRYILIFLLGLILSFWNDKNY